MGRSVFRLLSPSRNFFTKIQADTHTLLNIMTNKQK